GGRIGSDAGWELALWDATTGRRRKLTFPPREHDPNRVSVTLTLQGKQVPNEDPDLWNCRSFAFNPTGRQFVTVGMRGVQLWDVERGEVTHPLSRDWFEKVAWGSGDRLLCVQTGKDFSKGPPNYEAVLFDTADRVQLARWPAPKGAWDVLTLSSDAQ